MLRTDSENLRVAAADGDGRPLYLHFDTGGNGTTLLQHWYMQHKEDFMAAGLFTLLVLFLHIWTGGQIEIVQVIILFCINCIASVNFGALLRYEILT